MRIFTYSLQGERDYNEDRFCIYETNQEKTFCLFDGHGGHFVSTYLSKNINKYLTNCFSEKEISTAIKSIQNRLKKKYFNKSGECGSTLLIIRLNIKESKLQLINLGDSRAIIKFSKGVRQLNTEHKPTEENERVRLALSKKTIEYDKEDEIYRIDGYALSRSMGDTAYTSISQSAEIKTIQYKNIKYVLLASDGLWDVMSNEEVDEFITKHIKPTDSNEVSGSEDHNIAFLLATHAHKIGSMDNITVIIVFLDD